MWARLSKAGDVEQRCHFFARHIVHGLLAPRPCRGDAAVVSAGKTVSLSPRLVSSTQGLTSMTLGAFPDLRQPIG
jgi:hypothetical protein